MILFICKLFKSVCKLVSWSLMAFPLELLMSRQLQCFLQVCSTWQKPCSAKYIVGNTSNNSFNSPQSSGKRSLPATLIQKSDYPCAWNIAWASSSLWMSVRHFWMVESHSLMLASWQKSISPSSFLHNVTFDVIYTTGWLHSKPQTGGEKDFLDSLV